MAVNVKLGYDPKEAKKGFDDLGKQLDKTSKSLDQVGEKAIKAGKSIQDVGSSAKLGGLTTKFQHNADAVKKNTEGLGQFASAISQAGSAMGGASGQALAFTGQMGGMADAALSASAAFGPVGLAIAGVTAAVTVGVAVYQEYAEAERKAAEEAKALAEAQKEQQQAVRDRQSKSLQLDLAAVKEFQRLEAQLIQQQADRRLDSLTVATTAEEAARRAADLERENIALAKEAGTVRLSVHTDYADELEQQAAQEAKREKIGRQIHDNQVRINKLKQEESRIAADAQRSEQERLRTVEQRRREEEQAAREKERSLQEEKRRQLELAAIEERRHQANVQGIEAALQRRIDGGRPSGGGGNVGPDGRPIGAAQQPNPYGRFNRGGNLIAGQSAMAQQAQMRQSAAVAQPGNIRLGNADRQARGDFSMDRRGLTVQQMRQGAMGAGSMPGAGAETPGQLAMQLAGNNLGDAAIRDRIIENRQAQIEAQRGAALERFRNERVGPGGRFKRGDLGGSGERAINQQFDRASQRERRGVFREGGTEAEQAKAIAELTKEQAQQQGKANNELQKGLQQMLDNEAEMLNKIEQHDAFIKSFSKQASASGKRIQAQKAGRAP